MTTEELAGCVAVIKNLLLTDTIAPIRAVMALWELVDSVCDSAHYIPGTSPVIDRLCAEVGMVDGPPVPVMGKPSGDEATSGDEKRPSPLS